MKMKENQLKKMSIVCSPGFRETDDTWRASPGLEQSVNGVARAGAAKAASSSATVLTIVLAV